jgi:hypothetical protein
METGLMMKYFVLNPNKQDIYGEASRKAMMKYAAVIADKNKEFAEEIRNWVIKIQVINLELK